MEIAYLADHQELIPQLAAWFHAEFGYLQPEWSRQDVIEVLAKRIHRDRIPLALLALEEGKLLGTVSLKIHDMDTRLDLSPWLAGLYVSSDRRGEGIGAKLVCGVENKAHELGVQELYLYTPKSEHFYLRLDWEVKERLEYHNYPVTLMHKTIARHVNAAD